MKKLISILLPGILLSMIACSASGNPETETTAETITRIESTTEAEPMTETETETEIPAATTASPVTAHPTNTIPPGQTPFSLGFQVNTSARAQAEDGAVVIASKQALDQFAAQYGDVNNRLSPRLAPYNDAWFSTRSLIMITRTEGSGSIRHTTERLIAKDGWAMVFISRSVPDIGTADMAYWVIALEVQNSDMAGMTQAQAAYFFYNEDGYYVMGEQ